LHDPDQGFRSAEGVLARGAGRPRRSRVALLQRRPSRRRGAALPHRVVAREQGRGIPGREVSGTGAMKRQNAFSRRTLLAGTAITVAVSATQGLTRSAHADDKATKE